MTSANQQPLLICLHRTIQRINSDLDSELAFVLTESLTQQHEETERYSFNVIFGRDSDEIRNTITVSHASYHYERFPH